MKTNNPHNKPETGLSVCCNAPTNTIPASMGEPSLTFCSHCKAETKIVWKPMFERISKGHYRKIYYELTNK